MKLLQNAHKRIFGLDVLRALAILFVVVSHGRHLMAEPFQSLHKYFMLDGVSMFFVLSGFLIGGILIKLLEKYKTTPKLLVNFWMRRWLRTLPNYFAALLAITLSYMYLTDDFHFGDVKSYYFFVQNLWYPHPPFFPEAWSLSIEEWFYLTVPLLLFFFILVFKTSARKTVFYTAIFILVAVTAYRFFVFKTQPMQTGVDWDQMLRKQVVTRLDSLMFGMLGAYVSFYHTKLWHKVKTPSLWLGIIIMLATKLVHILNLVSPVGFYNSVFSFTFFAVGTLLTLPYLSQWKDARGFSFRFFTFFSLISYSLYLVHFTFVQAILLPQLQMRISIFQNPFVAYFSFWGISILLALLMYFAIEKPGMHLRDKPWLESWFGKQKK